LELHARNRAVRLLGILHFFLEARPLAHSSRRCRGGSWERHRTCLRPVRVSSPFRPVGVWLLRRELGPTHPPPRFLGRHRISMVMPGPALCSTVMCFLFLPGARITSDMGQAPPMAMRLDGGLSVREDRDPFRGGACLLEAVSSALAKVVHSASS